MNQGNLDHSFKKTFGNAGLRVHLFNYTGKLSVTDAVGQTSINLPQGVNRFLADLNGIQFWNSENNKCVFSGCAPEDIIVTIPMTVRVEGVDYFPFEGINAKFRNI
jgi:hypothetical protein